MPQYNFRIASNTRRYLIISISVVTEAVWLQVPLSGIGTGNFHGCIEVFREDFERFGLLKVSSCTLFK
jgi:hypothetical protein